MAHNYGRQRQYSLLHRNVNATMIDPERARDSRRKNREHEIPKHAKEKWTINGRLNKRRDEKKKKYSHSHKHNKLCGVRVFGDAVKIGYQMASKYHPFENFLQSNKNRMSPK